jgi:outer membrane protein OmpA-like peptidoglycan-associated protein
MIAFASGCASKGYVRNQVKDSNDQLNVKIDTNVKRVDTNIAELSDQVGETTRVTRENTNQIGVNATQIRDTSSQLQVAKAEIKTADDKAGGAMSAAETAKAAVGETGKRVDGLANQFANRNNYGVAAEDSVRFAFNSAKLQPEFHTVLDTLAAKVKQDPDAVIVLEGRTDSTGDADYNIKLGQQRMDAVLRYLVVQSDVPIQRVFQVSLGKEKPVADNKTKEGREQNRATVIRVLSPTATGAVAAK